MAKTDLNRERADALVAVYGRWIGVRDAHLDEKGDRAFGGVGFHHALGDDVLQCRVLIEKGYALNDSENIREKFRAVARALADPTIGGMFERGGGRIVLDEEKRTFFLIYDFELGRVASLEFRAKVEDLIDIGAHWTLRWFSQVARVAHGVAPRPGQFTQRPSSG